MFRSSTGRSRKRKDSRISVMLKVDMSGLVDPITIAA